MGVSDWWVLLGIERTSEKSMKIVLNAGWELTSTKSAIE